MIFIYHILLTLFFFLALPVLPFLYLLSEKRRANLLQRLGILTGFEQKASKTFRIWIHALSVGEVRSSLPFVLSLKKRKPLAEIVFTASTKTGFETAQQLFCQDSNPMVSQMGYFPFDIWFSILRITHLIDPDLVCLIETDYWPGFLYHMKQQNVPVVLINARLSKRSLKGYLRMGHFSSLFLSNLSHIMAQTPLDAQRFTSTGIAQARLSIMGNIKFDQESGGMDDARMAELKTKFNIQDQDLVWIAGSTHEGEESLLLDAFTSVKKKIPELKLILAPRDPKRSEKLIKKAPAHPCSCVLFSELKPGMGSQDIIFMDKMGVLAASYAICDLAFIGGSLVPQGGHNPIEPAMFGKPVLLGPHYTDFLQVSDLLVEENGACRVETGFELEEKLEKILKNPSLAAQMGEASYRVFSGNSGAVARTIDKMEDLAFV